VFTEQRQSTRKILKAKAALVMEGEAPLACRTTDVSSNGVSLQVPNPIRSGQAGQVMFDLLVDGKIVNINARAKVQYCILSQGEFKVGLEFLNLPLAAMTSLSRFLR
jgi:c-di-GMP-binding flagellar brake protein YcgR